MRKKERNRENLCSVGKQGIEQMSQKERNKENLCSVGKQGIEQMSQKERNRENLCSVDKQARHRPDVVEGMEQRELVLSGQVRKSIYKMIMNE